MAFQGIWASADGSLALNISKAGDDGSFKGSLTYAGNSYPILNGSWHNGVTPASTYCFVSASGGGPLQLNLGASGIITGAAFGGFPSQITIAGSAATITGSQPTSPNALSLFCGILNPQK
jgi:hypothetical protein